jgi:threonine dehydratase
VNDNGDTSARPVADAMRRALAAIRPHLPATPLLRSDLLSRASGAEVWLKNETVTPIASFKLRGGLNGAMRAAASGFRGVATSSTGNHGQAVAYAARLLGLDADIFLPQEANPVKAAMIAAFGGTIHRLGRDIDEAKGAARRFARERGAAFLDDGDDVAVMEGAGTLGLEIAEALPDIDALILPMGGGNLAAGTGLALKSMQPRARLYTVQSEASPALTESFHARRPIERETRSIADGLAQRVPPRLSLEVLWEILDDAWLVSDEELLSAMHSLAETAHVLVEPAGAASLAGFWRHRGELAGRRVVLLLSGANVTMELVRAALDRAPLLPPA